MATAQARTRSVLLMALAIPFLTNLMIRICALKSLVAFEGPLVFVLRFLSIEHDPFALSQNLPLVAFGMVSSYLPFMVFPLYAALERFDFSLLEAAQDLGATYGQALLKIDLPGIRPAVKTGFALVAIPALGEFAIPDLLGGAKVMLLGNLISEQFLKARDWPFGSAIGMILLVVLLFALLAMKTVRGGLR